MVRFQWHLIFFSYFFLTLSSFRRFMGFSYPGPGKCQSKRTKKQVKKWLDQLKDLRFFAKIIQNCRFGLFLLSLKPKIGVLIFVSFLSFHFMPYVGMIIRTSFRKNSGQTNETSRNLNWTHRCLTYNWISLIAITGMYCKNIYSTRQIVGVNVAR